MLCNRSSEASWHLALVRAVRDHRVVRAMSMWMWRQHLTTSQVIRPKFENIKNDSIRRFYAQLCGVWIYWSVLKMDLCFWIDLVKARCVRRTELNSFLVQFYSLRALLIAGVSIDFETPIPADGSIGRTEHSRHHIRKKESCSCLLSVMVEIEDPSNGRIIWCKSILSADPCGKIVRHTHNEIGISSKWNDAMDGSTLVICKVPYISKSSSMNASNSWW